MIAKELSIFCITMLTDEYCTSKVCSKCNKKTLEYPIMEHIKVKRIKDKETGIRKKIEIIVKRECHRLCYCKCNNHLSNTSIDSHKTWWNRDYNSSRDILHVGTSKLLGKRLGEFSRKKKDNLEEEQMCFSLGKRNTEKGISKKISRKTKTTDNNENQITESKVVKIKK